MKLVPAPLSGLKKCVLAATLAALPYAPAHGQAGEWEQLVSGGPGPSVPDVFHPDRENMPAPRRGGRVIVHLASKPKNINYMLENSSSTRRILREVHETLVERDWETWEHRPVVARSWVTEDTLVLKGGRGAGPYDNVLFGAVTDGGAHYLVTPVSPDHPLSEATKVPKEEVEEVLYGTVFTFDLREGVKWHDGHTFDTGDVLFSFQQYLNPHVDCDQIRFKFQQFAGAEVLSERRIRFLYRKQYFMAVNTFEDLTLLPSHVYNLSDPDNPDYREGASAAEQGVYLNEHENNTKWIGLGPYRVTEVTSQYVDAERFVLDEVGDDGEVRQVDGYFDPENSGWVDAIRWRYIASDDTAKQAVINGEIDYWDRLRPEDYYGQYTQSEDFTDNYYKGIKAFPYTGYIAWNMRLPKFKDPNVRKALSHCFDHDNYVKSTQHGLASPVTFNSYYFSRYYDRDLERLGFDLVAAEDLLLEAGWYDRDGDGVIDKDGEPFTIEYLMPTGNKASEQLAQTLQKNLTEVGIKMTIVTREWATYIETLYDREFECANSAWISEVEADQEQVWHSRWVDGRSANHSGMDDEIVDELIEKIQVELDDDKREELFHQLQARVYGLYPYIFLFNKPHKFAVSKRIRNFRTYATDPGYRIRDWFLVEDDASGSDAQ